MSEYSTQPDIELYLCSDFLECYNDDELYSYFQTVVFATDLCFLGVYFIQLEDRRVVEDYFSEYPSLSCNSNLIGYLDGKYDWVAQGAEQGVWNMNMDDFNKKMEEIRKNELYG